MKKVNELEEHEITHTMIQKEILKSLKLIVFCVFITLPVFVFATSIGMLLTNKITVLM